jgi:hypothetical protein
MIETPGTVRHVAWRELFPWLILFRTFRIAISPTLLAIATVAVLVAPWGWRVAGRVFLTAEARQARALAGEEIPRAVNSQLAAEVPAAPRLYFPSATSAILEVYFDLAEPLKRFFQLKISLREAAYYAFGFLWTLAVWAFPGGVVTRRAIVQLATDSGEGIRATASYAGRRYVWYFLAPLYPLLGVILLAAPISLVGLVLRFSPGIGALVAGLLWLFVAIAGLGAMWLLAGLLLGWPLMWPTISAERDGDPFEAFSRSYSYVYGQPLHYFFYVVVAATFGALCGGVVTVAAELVQEFGFWALAWGGGGQRVGELREDALRFAAGGSFDSAYGGLWSSGATMIGLVVAVIQAVTAAFRFTFFFAAASAIYLLLRQDVDEKPMDEVYLETPGEKPTS